MVHIITVVYFYDFLMICQLFSYNVSGKCKKGNEDFVLGSITHCSLFKATTVSLDTALKNPKSSYFESVVIRTWGY